MRRVKDHREGVFLEVINQLEAQLKSVNFALRGYVRIAILSIETLLVIGYGRTKEEIDKLRRLA